VTDPTLPGADPDRPWLAWPVGARVVVRRRLDGGGYSDVLGEVLTTDDDGVRVATRRGPVRVGAAEIAIGKLVPPAPSQRAPRRSS